MHHLCEMHFGSCAVSHDYQSKRYENINYCMTYVDEESTMNIIDWPMPAHKLSIVDDVTWWETMDN